MACTIDLEWIDARIAKTKELIVAYEDAIEALSSGAQSYSINTGQTTQAVTRVHLSSLSARLDQLENRLATLQAKRCGGMVHVKPGW